ncbi:hypothetical protein Tco_1128725 [Tanacetum coccineum]
MIGCEMMITLANVEFESILILDCHAALVVVADKAQSSRVPTPFPEDPYEAIRQACLVETDTESEPSEDPIDTETPELPRVVASVSPTTLPDSIPPACHTEESKDSDTSGARSTSSDSTAPLSSEHLLTRTSPNAYQHILVFIFIVRMSVLTVRAQPVISLGHSARVTEAMALSDPTLRKRYRSSYETSSSSSPALPVRKRYRRSELILDTDSEEDEIGEEDTNDDEVHGLDDEGHGLDDGIMVPVVGRQSRAATHLGLGLCGALSALELAVKEDQYIQAALRRDLQEMRGRVTALKQERDRRER